MDSEEPNPELLNRQPKWFKPVLVFMIITTAALAVWILLPPLFIRAQPYKRAEKVEATSNARQIGIALLEFDNDYGKCPAPDTIALINTKHPTHTFDLSGTSSNAFFRQLFAVEITQSEQMFHAQISGVRRPDGVITHGEALKKGEVGFSYISGISIFDLSTAYDPNTPIVLTPLIPGTTKFDPKPFDGKAIVLHIDCSVRTYDIAKDGHIYDAKGINLLSPKNPVWKGKTPDTRYLE